MLQSALRETTDFSRSRLSPTPPDTPCLLPRGHACLSGGQVSARGTAPHRPDPREARSAALSARGRLAGRQVQLRCLEAGRLRRREGPGPDQQAHQGCGQGHHARKLVGVHGQNTAQRGFHHLSTGWFKVSVPENLSTGWFKVPPAMPLSLAVPFSVLGFLQ